MKGVPKLKKTVTCEQNLKVSLQISSFGDSQAFEGRESVSGGFVVKPSDCKLDTVRLTYSLSLHSAV